MEVDRGEPESVQSVRDGALVGVFMLDMVRRDSSAILGLYPVALAPR